MNVLKWMIEISKNVVAPAYLLRRLAESSDSELKMAVADHKNTPLNELLMLAEDENPDARFALAENHNIGQVILNKFCDDSNLYAAHRADKTLMRPRVNAPMMAWIAGLSLAVDDAHRCDSSTKFVTDHFEPR